MRTKTLLLTAALVAAGVASSMAQSNVYSLNIVGYVNVPVQAGRFYILNNPLDDGKGDVITNVLNLSFDSAALDGSSLFTFSQTAGFVPEGWFDAITNWFPGTTVLPPGTGFFFQPNASTTLTFVGSVVLASTNTLPPGFTLTGSAYPAATNVTTLGFTGQDGDSIFRFFPTLGTSGSYGSGAGYFAALPGWFDSDFPTPNAGGGGPTNGPTPNVAEGFFYFNAQTTSELVTQNFSVQ
jgi:hypothetical protein